MTLPYAPPIAAGVTGGGTAATCAACAAPLALDQRFCVGCGLRLAPDELRLAALPGIAVVVPTSMPALGVLRTSRSVRERPFVRSAAVTTVVVLSLGIGIGATIGPAAVSETAAAQHPVIVLAGAPAAASAIAPELSAPLDDLSSTSDASSSSADDGSDAAAADTSTEPAASDPPADESPASSPPTDPTDDGSDEPAPAPDVAPPGSKALAGVVVAVAASGDGFTLADRSGALIAVHASGCGVVPGDDLHLRARKLANGTWAADRVRRVRDGVAEIRTVGVVSWVDPAGGRYALSARGTTLLVTAAAAPVAPASAATTPAVTAAPAEATMTTPVPSALADASATVPEQSAAAAPPALPTVGAQLRVRLAPQPQQGDTPAALLERVRTVLPLPDPTVPPAPAAPLELDGAIVTVDQQVRSVVLALDDAVPPTATVTLSVPPALDLARLLPAQRIAATATVQSDGSYALTGTSADGDAASADDATTLQGDQVSRETPAGSETAQTVPPACTML